MTNTDMAALAAALHDCGVSCTEGRALQHRERRRHQRDAEMLVAAGVGFVGPSRAPTADVLAAVASALEWRKRGPAGEHGSGPPTATEVLSSLAASGYAVTRAECWDAIHAAHPNGVHEAHAPAPLREALDARCVFDPYYCRTHGRQRVSMLLTRCLAVPPEDYIAALKEIRS